MSDDEIKAIANEIRRSHAGLEKIDLEAILARHIKVSKLQSFWTAFKKPAPWVAGVIGLWVEGLLPEGDLNKLVAGVTIGAAIDSLSEYLKQRGRASPIPRETMVWPQPPSLLDAPDSTDVIKTFMSGVVSDLMANGYSPPSLDERRLQSAYRVALNSPRFKVLVV